MISGRFAPSPTSALHVGNLRTALAAWLLARSTGRGFLVRVEDLDAGRVAAAPGVARQQLDDLAALGLDRDGPVVWQSERLGLYEEAATRLPRYECFCTRREIAEAASAPHDDGYRPYPGTCRTLSAAERAARRALRPPALRVAADGATVTVVDRWAGEVTGVVDDFVIRRNDGAWAYNLAVVVDDLAQGVDQVCRGDDLLSSSPRQAWLAHALTSADNADALPAPTGGRLVDRRTDYAHVGLVVNEAGQRLAKRDGAVTLDDLAGLGLDAPQVLALLGASLGLCSPAQRVDLATLLARFDPAVRPPTWTWRGPGRAGTARSTSPAPPHP